jgi:hypothetical protein
VKLGSFVGVMPRVKRVSPCGVCSVSPCGACMMGRFFVVSGLMMLSCFAVVMRGMRMVLCRLLMGSAAFLDIAVSSVWWPVRTLAGNIGTPISVKAFLYDGTLSRLVAIFRKPAAHNSTRPTDVAKMD